MQLNATGPGCSLWRVNCLHSSRTRSTAPIGPKYLIINSPPIEKVLDSASTSSNHAFRPRLPATPFGHAFRPRLSARPSDHAFRPRLPATPFGHAFQPRLSATPSSHVFQHAIRIEDDTASRNSNTPFFHCGIGNDDKLNSRLPHLSHKRRWRCMVTELPQAPEMVLRTGVDTMSFTILK